VRLPSVAPAVDPSRRRGLASGLLPRLQAMKITADVLHRSWREWISSELDRSTPEWLQWLWTGVFALAIGLGFTVVGLAAHGGRNPGIWFDGGVWWRYFRVNFAVSLTISVLIHLMFLVIIPLVGTARIRRFSDRRRVAFFIAIPLVGVILGWPLGIWLVGQDVARWIRTMNAAEFVSSAVIAGLVSFVFFLVFSARAKQTLAEKRAIEAQLKLLQAQMEPHFLFNTLAGVQTLIDVEPERAKRMLESFTDYLRATLASLRTDQSTLGQELALAEAYLGLMQQRMEDRLAFTVDVDPGLRDAPMPALLLQPLVENAIHHGLEPKLEGGQVHIRARRDGDALLLDVQDDGLGPEATRRRSNGNGVALDNIRQRLAGRWGDDAALSLQPQQPGMRATLRFPLDTARAR
jgi:two-component sensor histidine kinase